jgi:hypothetical protein
MWHVIQNICILVQQFPAINKTDNTVLRSMKITVKKVTVFGCIGRKIEKLMYANFQAFISGSVESVIF